MKKIFTTVCFCGAALLSVIGSTFAWFSASRNIVESATIGSGKMEVSVAVYKAFDASKDGTKDILTREEVNEYGATFEMPDRVEDVGQYFAKEIDYEGTSYYNLYEKMPDPCDIILSDMVMSEVYSYIIVVYNNSLSAGNLFVNLSGCLGGLTPILKINDQCLRDIVDEEGNGRYYFTYLLDEEPPILNGTTAEEKAVQVGGNERLIVPFDLSLDNDPNVDQSEYMNKEVLNIDAKIEVEQLLSE